MPRKTTKYQISNETLQKSTPYYLKFISLLLDFITNYADFEFQVIIWYLISISSDSWPCKVV